MKRSQHAGEGAEERVEDSGEEGSVSKMPPAEASVGTDRRESGGAGAEDVNCYPRRIRCTSTRGQLSRSCPGHRAGEKIPGSEARRSIPDTRAEGFALAKVWLPVGKERYLTTCFAETS